MSANSEYPERYRPTFIQSRRFVSCPPKWGTSGTAVSPTLRRRATIYRVQIHRVSNGINLAKRKRTYTVTPSLYLSVWALLGESAVISSTAHKSRGYWFVIDNTGWVMVKGQIMGYGDGESFVAVLNSQTLCCVCLELPSREN